MLKKTTLALLTAMLSANVLAHSAWIAPQQGKLAIIYGHGAESDAYKADQVKDLKGYIKGKESAITLKDHGDFVSVNADKSEVVSFVFYNGIWTKLKNGEWEQKPRDQVKGEVDFSTESTKYAVTLLDHGVTPKAVGHLLELVPEQNPLDMHEGDTVTVKVLFNGKPLAGAKVTNDYVNSGDDAYKETDKDGKVTLTIRNNGLNVFEVGHKADNPDRSKADKVSLSASYSFVLHNHEH